MASPWLFLCADAESLLDAHAIEHAADGRYIARCVIFGRRLPEQHVEFAAVFDGGNAATVEAVATGECAYGLTDTDDALAAIGRGLPLAMTLPRSLPAGTAGGGTMLVPNTVCAIAGGPGDAARADLVAAFLVSPECEEIIARSPSRNLPLGPKATARVPFAEPDPLGFDLLSASDRAMEGAIAAKARLEESAS